MVAIQNLSKKECRTWFTDVIYELDQVDKAKTYAECPFFATRNILEMYTGPEAGFIDDFFNISFTKSWIKGVFC